MTERIVLASGNPGKIKEIRALLTNKIIVPQSDLNVPEADENGLTFVENAIIKARNACQYSDLPTIADDSGIEVDALFGAPGVISARYAGVGASDQENLEKLLREMADVPDNNRSARFRCVMVYLRSSHDPSPIISEGVWGGTLMRYPQGKNGFGYDPIFYVPDQRCSSAALEPQVKNSLSHRGKALKTLVSLMEQFEGETILNGTN